MAATTEKREVNELETAENHLIAAIKLAEQLGVKGEWHKVIMSICKAGDLLAKIDYLE